MIGKLHLSVARPRTVTIVDEKTSIFLKNSQKVFSTKILVFELFIAMNTNVTTGKKLNSISDHLYEH